MRGWGASAPRRACGEAFGLRVGLRATYTALLVTALCAVVGAGVADAAIASFGAEGDGAGEFREPRGLAVSQEAGEVFVIDRNNARIDVFDRSGAFLRVFGWGVADNKEELQSCTSSCFSGFEGSGTGELRLPEGAAVDNDLFSASQGDVYVGDLRNHRIQKFTPTGEFLLMFGGEVNATTKENVCLAGESCQAGTEGSGPGQFQATVGSVIAVGAGGSVYVGDRDRVQRFSPGGVFEGEVELLGAGAIETLAVDAAGDIYIRSSEQFGVHKYDDATGAELDAPRDEAGFPGVIALGPGGELFLSDQSAGHHIFEYDTEGKQLSAFDATGEGNVSAIAYDEVAKALYVLNPTMVRAVEVPPPGPLIVSQKAEEILPTSAKLAGLINPEGPSPTSYHFEYGTNTAYGSSTPSEELTGGEFEDQLASAAISGLTPGTLYHFRLVATNAAAETTLGPDQTFTTLAPVLIDGESVSHVSAESARLEAELNPLGLPTEYRFEYGTTEAYGEAAPVPDASAGEDSQDVHVSTEVQRLTPETTYHYRLSAHNALGTVHGPDQSFRTQAKEARPALLDGRAWEMVSPADKQGVSLEAIAPSAVIQASASGDAFTYVAKAPVTEDAQGNRSALNSQVLSRRTSPGVWASEDIATAHEEVAGFTPGQGSEYQLFSSDLSRGFVEPHGATLLAPEDPANIERTPYRRELDGSYTPLLTSEDVKPGVKFGGEELGPGHFESGVFFATATPDGAHALLYSKLGLTPGVESGELDNVYEWSEGALSLVSVLPNGRPASQEGATAAAGFANFSVRHAISDDGRRVVFESGSAGLLNHSYIRDTALGQTIRIDTAEQGLREATAEASFESASADGSHIFFLDEDKLTRDSTSRVGKDLYECEVRVTEGKLGCTLNDLSIDTNAGESADVQGVVLGTDEAGHYVYFVANGRLAPGAVRGNCTEEPTSERLCNLYMRDTAAGTTRLVAVVSGADTPDWFPSPLFDLGEVTSRVSPNGRYLAFMSRQPLTGFDNRDAASGERAEEVFEYDREAGTLTCVSCAASGARPEGLLDPGGFPGLLVDRPGLWTERWLAASVPGWTKVSGNHALYQSRYLADSGRLFFNSAMSLVPVDGNGLEDVYEYEPAGVGGCALSSGCVGLSSSGQSGEESAFMDASADGSDVFFLTAGRLSSFDTDGAYDVYDAHVCTLAAPCAPAAPEPPPPPCGTADACRAAPAPQPDIFGAPSSESFKGQGNITPAPKVHPKLTRAQKLAKALAVCKKKKSKAKRAACVKRARKLYGPRKKLRAKKGASAKQGGISR